MRLPSWLRLVLCFLIIGSSSPVHCGKSEIARPEALGLVMKWLADTGYETKSPKFQLATDPDQADFPDFYFFSANYAVDHSAPTLGHFAVNRRTADLWDWEVCKRLQSPLIKAAQESLRRKIGLSRKDYQTLSKIAPCTE